MKIAELKDRVVLGAARVYARRTMADYAERAEESQFEVTVTRVVELNPVMRRITLSAPEIRDYSLLGPDEYFGLFMPPADAPVVTPPDDERDPRSAVAAMDDAVRPQLRWYTIRMLRPEHAEIDVDIVDVGHDGPGARWLRDVRVGDEVEACHVVIRRELEAVRAGGEAHTRQWTRAAGRPCQCLARPQA